MMRIILGSQSPWRKRILEEMGYEVEVMPADIDEKQHRFDNPDELTLRLAREKAKAIAPQIEGEALLVTSDTVGVWNGEIREKPVDEAQARQFLHDYQEEPVDVVCAVIVTNTKTGETREGVEHARVHFNTIPEEALDALIADGTLFGCAAGFCIQHPLFGDVIARVDGETECVAGMPHALTRRLLDEMIGLSA